MYALFSFIFHRKSVQHRNRHHWRHLTWVTLMAGVTVGLGLILWCWIAPEKSDQRLRLTGFLGTVYAEGWPDRVDRLEYPPVKAQSQTVEEKPVYALLHPETPSSQGEPEKKLIRPRPSRAAKTDKKLGAADKAGKSAKAAKAPASQSKKDKVAGKSRVKKKNRTSAAEGKKNSAG